MKNKFIYFYVQTDEGVSGKLSLHGFSEQRGRKAHRKQTSILIELSFAIVANY